MEIYGESGYVMADNKNDIRFRNQKMKGEENIHITSNDVSVYEDPFEYFAGVITGEIKVEPFSTYSLENNFRVIEILDAARQSAKEEKTIYLK